MPHSSRSSDATYGLLPREESSENSTLYSIIYMQATLNHSHRCRPRPPLQRCLPMPDTRSPEDGEVVAPLESGTRSPSVGRKTEICHPEMQRWMDFSRNAPAPPFCLLAWAWEHKQFCSALVVSDHPHLRDMRVITVQLGALGCRTLCVLNDRRRSIPCRVCPGGSWNHVPTL
jgi:hypothetical protein